jgi:predicted DNA-binding protein (UPF0251 family)
MKEISFKFTEKDVRAMRLKAGLTQQRAAESMLLKSSSSWRDWENSRFKMGKARVEYFCMKNNLCFNEILADSGNEQVDVKVPVKQA